MRWRQVIVLWLACGALAADYWLVERPRAPAAPTHPARRRFLAVDPADVHELRLERGARRLVARRAGERWEVVEPADAAVPPDLLAAFADALARAEEIDVMAPDTDLRAYGLDGPADRVEIVGASGEPLVVTLGGPNATGTALYARRGSAPVVLIGRNVRYYEDLILEAVPAPSAPAVDQDAPVGG